MGAEGSQQREPRPDRRISPPRCPPDVNREPAAPDVPAMTGQGALLPPRRHRRGSDKRFDSRLLVSTLRCSLGRILDISGGGMRVRGFARRGLRQWAIVSVRIQGLATPIEVEVEVAWVRPCGPFRREMGLAFTGLTPEAKVALRPLFRTASQLNGRSAA